jgi:hypothetical protein
MQATLQIPNIELTAAAENRVAAVEAFRIRFSRAGQITSTASASRFIGLPSSFERMNPLSVVCHTFPIAGREGLSVGLMTGIAPWLFGRLGSSTWLRQTDFSTRISEPS